MLAGTPSIDLNQLTTIQIGARFSINKTLTGLNLADALFLIYINEKFCRREATSGAVLQPRSKMRYIFASLTVCIVTAAAVPAWAQNPPVYRDPHASRAVAGPDPHDGMAADQKSATGPVVHPISRHARIHYPRGTHPPQHRKVAHAHPVRAAGSTAEQLNREELARINGDAQMPAAAEAASAAAMTPRALEGPRASRGAR